MATVTKKQGEPVYPPPTFVLEMTQGEAQYLFDILYWGVAGGGTRRVISSNIMSALRGYIRVYEHRPADMSGEVFLEGKP